jgi:hypothetical protein
VCHYAVMMPYAAYLRVYEPLSAFSEPERTRWAAYATSAARTRRMNALAEEHKEALRRVAAVPPVVIPERESGHAYVRWHEGVTYVCPWQTRLRSWLALSELRATAEPPLADILAAPAVREAASLAAQQASERIYIRTSTWTIPITWFSLFAPTERSVASGGAQRTLGTPQTPMAPRPPLRMGGLSSPPYPMDSPGEGLAPSISSVKYGTTISLGRQRVTRALAVVRGAIRQLPDSRGRLLGEALATEAELTGLLRWLAEFHPYSLIELDYGGLVRLLSDQALRSDESVAEISAAIEALARSEWEVALAMHHRAIARWRVPRATAYAN